MGNSEDLVTTNEELFKYYTGKAGDINRQFGLVAVGIIWLFHGIQAHEGKELQQPLDSYLVFALYMTVCSLSIDLLQYMIGAFMWGNEFLKNPLKPAKECKKCIGWSNGIIFVKLLLMFTAYVSLLMFLFSTNFI